MTREEKIEELCGRAACRCSECLRAILREMAEWENRATIGRMTVWEKNILTSQTGR